MKYIILIVVAVFLYQHFNQADAKSLNEKHGSDVIMYSTQWCGYCKKARVTLNMQGVRYKELDIEKSAEAAEEMRSVGGRGVPVFVIKGEVIRGYDQSRVLELIKTI